MNPNRILVVAIVAIASFIALAGGTLASVGSIPVVPPNAPVVVLPTVVVHSTPTAMEASASKATETVACR